MKFLLLLLLLSIPVFGQSIPDAPIQQKTTTCIENNGNPCPHWLHKLIGQYPPIADDNIEYPKYGPGVFSFRTKKDRELATNRQALHSKFFWVSNGMLTTSMIVACTHDRTTGENFGSEAGAVGGVIVLNYISYRFLSPSFLFGTNGYGTYHYIHSFFK